MNLQNLKLLVSGLIAFLLIGGYIGSQYFYWNGIAPAWIAVIDVPSIKHLSLFLFVGSVLYFYFGDGILKKNSEIEGESA